MGSFPGHAIPGSFLFVFGFWWITQVMRRHFRCRLTRETFHATATFPVPCCPARAGQRMRNMPVETILKMGMCGVGVVAELCRPPVGIGNIQHITMYVFFGFGGVMDLLVLKGLAPPGTDYVGIIVALLVEGALFKFHLYGRNQLDLLLHTLLLYVIGFSAVVVALEAAYRKTTVLPILRGLLFMQQGTWFWQVAFILYNPHSHKQVWPPDHHHLMLTVASFCWHLAVNLILVIIVGGVTACCYRNKARYSTLSTAPPGVAGSEEEVGLVRREWGRLEFKHDETNGVKKNGLLPFHQDDDDDDLSDLEFEAPVVKSSETMREDSV